MQVPLCATPKTSNTLIGFSSPCLKVKVIKEFVPRELSKGSPIRISSLFQRRPTLEHTNSS